MEGRRISSSAPFEHTFASVDLPIAETMKNKAVKVWHTTNYSNGRKRVYITFEEVVSVVPK